MMAAPFTRGREGICSNVFANRRSDPAGRVSFLARSLIAICEEYVITKSTQVEIKGSGGLIASFVVRIRKCPVDSTMINANKIVGTHDVVFLTLDTLRLDVAVDAMKNGLTPNLQSVLPDGKWEHRHTSGSFTYAAHQAFFAGFLPTPATPGPHPRLFAAKFLGSESATDQTCVFDAPDIVSGLAGRGYYTICVGGVGFFNKQTPLGCVLPNLFHESHWSPELGVTHRDSTEKQIDVAIESLERANDKRAFLFINVSALHQPNCIYAENTRASGVDQDTPATQAAALAYVDSQMPRLFEALKKRGPTFCILTSDHGTAYGEDGYVGHRVGHSVIWDVPYGEFEL